MCGIALSVRFNIAKRWITFPTEIFANLKQFKDNEQVRVFICDLAYCIVLDNNQDATSTCICPQKIVIDS